ncbi:hypothetical protein TURU_122192 [Turdus rufiventris]|nr:hypothetical protein TURU_122192 [Turdus rufiventris]
MIAELLSSALGFALYLNTLSADFCYDDRLGKIKWHHKTSYSKINFPMFLSLAEIFDAETDARLLATFGESCSKNKAEETD